MSETALQSLLDRMTAVVDTYHSTAHPLPTLIELRRELSGLNWNLANYVKQTYGTKALTYATRKHRTAVEIFSRIEEDEVATGVKKRAMNRLEVEAEASQGVLLARREEGVAEAEFEHVKAMLYAAKEVLSAMGQEIADARDEKGYQESINAHERNSNSNGSTRTSEAPEWQALSEGDF